MDYTQVRAQLDALESAFNTLVGYAVQQWMRDKEPSYQRSVEQGNTALMQLHALLDDAEDEDAL